MKVGLLADIHANDAALEAVLDAAQACNVEHLLIAGDLVGYYFAPRRVLELLDGWSYSAVRGNHEDLLRAARASPYALDDITQRYGPGVKIALEELTKEQLDYLCSLPHPLRITTGAVRTVLCHGSPRSIDRYVYPSATATFLATTFAENADLYVFGHTHYPTIFRVGSTVAVNPGSVGQPRNRIPGAHWALFDTETQSIDFRVEEYGFIELADKCEQSFPEFPYLYEVLRRK